jgi:hypothetical protein
MLWFYEPGFDYGDGQVADVHGFVLDKPSRIRAGLVAAPPDFVSPASLDMDDFRRFHDPAVLANLRDATAVARAVELDVLAEMPDEMVFEWVCKPQLLATAGTYSALRAAAQGHWAANLSGGYHHARRTLSHGFCLVNDVAIGIARLRHEGVRRRTLIVDLDLHQGDGNATAFADDRDVDTLSVTSRISSPFPRCTAISTWVCGRTQATTITSPPSTTPWPTPGVTSSPKWSCTLQAPIRTLPTRWARCSCRAPDSSHATGVSPRLHRTATAPWSSCPPAATRARVRRSTPPGLPPSTQCGEANGPQARSPFATAKTNE